jgi:hypothetical protein
MAYSRRTTGSEVHGVQLLGSQFIREAVQSGGVARA